MMVKTALYYLSLFFLACSHVSADVCSATGVSVQLVEARLPPTSGPPEQVAGYRVQVGNASIVFGGDQAGTDPRFIELAKRADLLVMHLAVGAGESSQGHASPARVGQIAREAMAGQLIVSHLGPGLVPGGPQLKPEIDVGPALAELRKYYDGPVTVGQDLACTAARK
jgi:ribonuclease BN (tRNA processing enzyme)